jgi:uncharacterized Zn finger protein (UPF0148 family)
VDLLSTILTWIINLACIYLAYLAVREVERTIVRRVFSLMLTLVLVVVTSGLLIGGVGVVSSVLISLLQSSYYTSSDRWVAVVGSILALGIVALIWRDVAARLHGETCPQCGTALQGKTVCPNCGWGGLSLPDSMADLARQASAQVSAMQSQATARRTAQAAQTPPAPEPTASAMQAQTPPVSEPAKSPTQAPAGAEPARPTMPASPAPEPMAPTMQTPSAPQSAAPPMQASPSGPEPPIIQAATVALICPNCGAANAAGATTCARCGSALT